MLGAKHRTLAGSALVTACLFAVRPVTAQGLATIDVDGAIETQIYGMNNNWDVVGMYFTALSAHSFVRLSEGTVSDVECSGATFTVAYDINDEGQIVGFYGSSEDEFMHGFVKTGESCAPINIGTGDTRVWGINSDGDVVGDTNDWDDLLLQQGPWKGFVLPTGSGATTFALDPDFGTWAIDISDDDIIVGVAEDDNGFHLFRRVAGLLNVLDVECLVTPDQMRMSINSAHTIVGSGSVGSFSCSSDGLTVFSHPDAVGGTWVTAINDNNEIAGFYLDDMWVGHGFIGPLPPHLKLFLDVDGNFEMNEESDIDDYVPGSNLSGASVVLPQTVTLVAAYVDADGEIVEPPEGVTTINVSLTETSAFTGIAMNSGDETTDDFELEDASAEFDGNYAVVTLNALDYGGFTLAYAQVDGGSDVASLAVPTDDNGNGIADRGWHVSRPDSEWISDTDPDGDADVGPLDNPFTGDNLVAFEEYRGFIVDGDHVRTHPAAKDLFVYPDTGSYGHGNSAALSITVWAIMETEYSGTRVINYNYLNNGFGGNVPGHVEQKGLYLKDEVYDSLHPNANHAGRVLISSGLVPNYPNNVVEVTLYSGWMKHTSPPTNDGPPGTTPDGVDNAKMADTIAHELGHALNLEGLSYGGNRCAPPALTIMLHGYFVQTISTIDCPWANIPTSFTDDELEAIRLK